MWRAATAVDPDWQLRELTGTAAAAAAARGDRGGDGDLAADRGVAGRDGLPVAIRGSGGGGRGVHASATPPTPRDTLRWLASHNVAFVSGVLYASAETVVVEDAAEGPAAAGHHPKARWRYPDPTASEPYRPFEGAYGAVRLEGENAVRAVLERLTNGNAWLKRLGFCPDFTRVSLQMFLSADATASQTHRDTSSSLLRVVSGRKDVYVAPPSVVPAFHTAAASDPNFLTTFDPFVAVAVPAPWRKVVLFPGDALFLPAQWWHRVRSTPGTIAVGVKCGPGPLSPVLLVPLVVILLVSGPLLWRLPTRARLVLAALLPAMVLFNTQR